MEDPVPDFRSLAAHKKILIELHFAPSLFYMWLLYNSDVFELETRENYNKRSFRNKCIMKSNVGSQLLSVPLLKGKNAQRPIREVEISYSEDWVRILRHTLQSEFGKSPYFEHYFEDIMNVFDKKHRFLFDLSRELLSYFCGCLSLSGVKESEEYLQETDPSVYDMRNTLTPKHYRKDPWLHSYTRIEYFEVNPGHSIVECLFNYGPETGYLLQRIKAQKG